MVDEIRLPHWALPFVAVVLFAFIGLLYERADRRVTALETKMEANQVHISTLEAKMEWVLEQYRKK